MTQKQGMSQEEVLREMRPHFLGLYSLYIVWTYIAILGVAFLLYRTEILQHVVQFLQTHISPFGHWVTETGSTRFYNFLYLGIWVAALLVPALVLAVSRINFWWIFILGATTALGIYLKEFSPLYDRRSGHYLPGAENMALVLIGCIGIIGTEIYRRSHRYMITDRRILIKVFGLVGYERSIFYAHIDDLVLSRPILGTIFGFGSIIPVTASGLGMGSNSAGGGVMGGVGLMGANVGGLVTGSQSRNVTRATISDVLFNVPRPQEIYDLIGSQIGARQP